jgi:hypothetical protein
VFHRSFYGVLTRWGTDNWIMTVESQSGSGRPRVEAEIPGKHFSCSMTAVLLARVHDYGGDDAVTELLDRAGSTRSAAYLVDIANWVSYAEAVALWRTGALITHHPHFARAVGEDAVRRLNSSPVASLLRSLGSPEGVYRQIAITSTKYSTVAELDAVDCRPGLVEIVARPGREFPRDRDHCAWTCGLLSQPTILFGLPAATVQHERCAAFGADECVYRVTWTANDAPAQDDASEQIATLREQLDAMKERLHSKFETAADLISAGEIADVLARITDRAAVEVRAPRHLLAVRMPESSELHCHHKGFHEQTAAAYAERILGEDPTELPDSCLVVPVRSNRHDYGRLLAMYDEGMRFLPQERDLLEVYARYAANALDAARWLAGSPTPFPSSSIATVSACICGMSPTESSCLRRWHARRRPRRCPRATRAGGYPRRAARSNSSSSIPGPSRCSWMRGPATPCCARCS